LKISISEWTFTDPKASCGKEMIEVIGGQ